MSESNKIIAFGIAVLISAIVIAILEYHWKD